jgi:hypothetical protein
LYDLAAVENRLMACQDLYHLAARPFNWKYTKKDLNALSSPGSPPTNQTHPRRPPRDPRRIETKHD